MFTKINLQPTCNIENPEFEEAYTTNRAKSFMHYWLYCIETANGNAEKFKELLADNFQFHLSRNGLINTFEAFESWIKSISEKVIIAGHIPKK